MSDAGTPVTVTESEARTVAFGAFVGTALEWYDFFLYGTAASLVFNRLFFASQDAVVALAGAFASFAVGFAARPLGAIIFGHLGDRIGRRRCLIVTLSMIGLVTGVIGLLPTYFSIGVAGADPAHPAAPAAGRRGRRRVGRRGDAGRRACPAGAARAVRGDAAGRVADRHAAVLRGVPRGHPAARRQLQLLGVAAAVPGGVPAALHRAVAAPAGSGVAAVHPAARRGRGGQRTGARGVRQGMAPAAGPPGHPFSASAGSTWPPGSSSPTAPLA